MANLQSGSELVIGGADIGSVNCGAATIGVKCKLAGFDVLGCTHASYIKVDGGIHATLTRRILAASKLTDNFNKPAVIGIEEFTMQRSSYTAFSIGEMNGYVRLMASRKADSLVLIPPSTLNSLCGCLKKDKRPDRKLRVQEFVEKLIGEFDYRNVMFESNKAEIEQQADAIGYAYCAWLALLVKTQKRAWVSEAVGNKIKLFDKFLDEKYWYVA